MRRQKQCKNVLSWRTPTNYFQIITPNPETYYVSAIKIEHACFDHSLPVFCGCEKIQLEMGQVGKGKGEALHFESVLKLTQVNICGYELDRKLDYIVCDENMKRKYLKS